MRLKFFGLFVLFRETTGESSIVIGVGFLFLFFFRDFFRSVFNGSDFTVISVSESEERFSDFKSWAGTIVFCFFFLWRFRELKGNPPVSSSEP